MKLWNSFIFFQITFPHELGEGVKANKIHHANTIDDPDWFNTRVKCFPFYSLMLAANLRSIDLFVLESGGTELQVLETIPFDRVHIQFIDVHLLSSDVEKDTIKEFLIRKNYTFLNNYNGSYVFRLNWVIYCLFCLPTLHLMFEIFWRLIFYTFFLPVIWYNFLPWQFEHFALYFILKRKLTMINCTFTDLFKWLLLIRL